MHGCARGPPPEGRWGGRSNPPLATAVLGKGVQEYYMLLRENLDKWCIFVYI